jgi:hypothetical protein
MDLEVQVSGQEQNEWQEAKRRCRLSDEEVRMAKELGLKPGSLIRNIPRPSQTWKAPVSIWVRSLYGKKIGSRGRAEATRPAATSASPRVIEFRNPDDPWPDHPEIPDLPPLDLDFETEDEDEEEDGCKGGFLGYGDIDRYEPPDEEEIDEQNGLLLRSQRLFRWAAQAIAVAVSQLPEVQKVAAFGAVARPLEMEVPRFYKFRRHRIEVLHECADLDLAVWVTSLSRLRELQKAMKRGLALVQDSPYGGVAHHQVDVHVFESATGNYRGRLCIFKECPKAGKRECFVPGCGAEKLLRQFEKYRFNPARFASESKVVLFDRESGFLVHLPKIEGRTRVVRWRGDQGGDVPS